MAAISLAATLLLSSLEFQATGLEHANWVTASQSDHAMPKVYLIWKLPATVPGIKTAPSRFRGYFEFFCAPKKRGFIPTAFLLKTFNSPVRSAFIYLNLLKSAWGYGIFTLLLCIGACFSWCWGLLIFLNIYNDRFLRFFLVHVWRTWRLRWFCRRWGFFFLGFIL